MEREGDEGVTRGTQDQRERGTGEAQASGDNSEEPHRHHGHHPDGLIPKRLADYREREYWERRYEQDQSRHYEWLLPYGETVRSLLGLRPTDRILILGCGNSRKQTSPFSSLSVSPSPSPSSPFPFAPLNRSQ